MGDHLVIGVGEEWEGQLEVVAMSGQPLLVDEGHRGEVSVAESVELVAHGDQVLLAGQSHQVTVEDQQDMMAPVIGERPRPAFVVEGSEIVDRFTLMHGDKGKPLALVRRFGVASPRAPRSSRRRTARRRSRAL